jgi:hypothetical protein
MSRFPASSIFISCHPGFVSHRLAIRSAAAVNVLTDLPVAQTVNMDHQVSHSLNRNLSKLLLAFAQMDRERENVQTNPRKRRHSKISNDADDLERKAKRSKLTPIRTLKESLSEKFSRLSLRQSYVGDRSSDLTSVC